MRVFITGAAGYVGSNLVLRLLQEPAVQELTLLVRSPDKGDMLLRSLPGDISRVKLVHGDLQDALAMDLNYDAVIHGAALRIADSARDPVQAIQVNLLTAWELIQRAQHCGAGSFIFLSTQAVYDFRHALLPVGELGPLKPGGLYAMTKLAAEQALQRNCQGGTMRWAALRMSRVYGWGLNTPWQELAGKFARDTVQGRLTVTNGRNEYDMVHIRDVCEFIVQLLKHPGGWNEIYNVGAGEICSVDRLAQICSRTAADMGLTPPEIIRPEVPAGEEQHFFLDISKARSRLGWIPQVSLEEGIKELLAALIASQSRQDEPFRP